MKPTGEDDLWPRPQFCSIYCPKCGRPAARLVYQTPVARYLHYSRTGAYWPWRSCSPWERMGFMRICGRR